jgi:hypothetical protein
MKSFLSHAPGPKPSIHVTRLQEHTPLPSSTFDLSFRGRSVSIPWDASANAVEALFESTFLEDSLNVPRPLLSSLSPPQLTPLPHRLR